jgi:hypothetical protein
MIDVRNYLNENYARPACFCLVTDFYMREFKFKFKDLDIKGKSVKELQTAFALSIMKDKLFHKVDVPQDGAIVLMYKKYTDRPDHCGIYLCGKVLHASYTLTFLEALECIRDKYDKIEFGVLNAS